jgi:hypothetical protein
VRVHNDIELVSLSKNETELAPDAQTLLQIKMDQRKFKCTLTPCFLEGYMLDHSEKCPEEEDSVERLWLVIRSLKSPEGKYVRNFKLSDLIYNRTTK